MQLVNNLQASPSRLAFITETEFPKFNRKRTSSDDIFTKGPDIGEFCESFRAYLARHDITIDKITALKMNMHASHGDAKYALSRILDDDINSEMIKFEQVGTLLKRVYKREEATSFYRSAKHFIRCVNNNNGQNSVGNLRSLEIALKEIHSDFRNRKA